MKVSALGQVYGKRFDCPPLRTNHVGAQLARQFGQAVVGRFNFKTPVYTRILGMPIFGNYERAQRRAGRRYGLIANLDPQARPASSTSPPRSVPSQLATTPAWNDSTVASAPKAATATPSPPSWPTGSTWSWTCWPLRRSSAT